jgi:hypothetical protein
MCVHIAGDRNTNYPIGQARLALAEYWRQGVP